MQRGHVFKKGHSWFVKFYDGRQRRCVRLAPVTYEYRNKSSVTPLADKILLPVNSRTRQSQSSLSAADFIQNCYLPAAAKRLRESTVLDYRYIFENHLQNRLGDTRLCDFKTHNAQTILDSLYESGVSHTRLLRVRAMLASVFAYALRTGVLQDIPNPVHGTKVLGRATKRKMPFYSLGEIDSLLRALRGKEPARTVLVVAAFSGLRLSELRGLRWQDFDGESLHIQRTVWRTRISDTKTEESKSSVPVLPFIAKLLEKLRGDSLPHDYIFHGEKGSTSLNLHNLARRTIQPAIKGVTLEGDVPLVWKGWHSFRRGLGTNLYSLNVPPKIIQAILRHAGLSTTLQYYVVPTDEESRQAMEKLGEQFGIGAVFDTL